MRYEDEDTNDPGREQRLDIPVTKCRLGRRRRVVAAPTLRLIWLLELTE